MKERKKNEKKEREKERKKERRKKERRKEGRREGRKERKKYRYGVYIICCSHPKGYARYEVLCLPGSCSMYCPIVPLSN